jgi:hypothetical protein
MRAAAHPLLAASSVLPASATSVVHVNTVRHQQPFAVTMNDCVCWMMVHCPCSTDVTPYGTAGGGHTQGPLPSSSGLIRCCCVRTATVGAAIRSGDGMPML